MDFLNLTFEQWLDLGLSLLIVVVTVSFGQWLVAFIIRRVISRVVARTRTGLDDAILDAMQPPLYGLAVVVAFDVGVTRLTILPAEWDATLSDVFFVLYLAVVFVFAWRLTTGLFNWYGQEVAAPIDMKLSRQFLPFFRRMILITLSVIVLIVLLDRFEANVSGLIATLGIGSLAIALAAQAALEDTLNGLFIMVDRPFRVGDRIEILDLDTWGDVVDVGLRTSRIRTRDNRMVIVPNSVIGKSLIVNHSYPNSEYRIEVHVGVAYGTDLELARQTMIEAVRGVEGVLLDQPIEALFLEFGASALIFRVRWWIESYVDTRRIFDRVNTAIYNALNEVGIDIPFPHLALQLDASSATQIANMLREAR